MDNSLVRLRQCFLPRQWFVGDGEPDPFVIADEESFMWVYRDDTSKIGRYQVGYFMPDGTWFAENSYGTKEAAAARVNYLNGGRHA